MDYQEKVVQSDQEATQAILDQEVNVVYQDLMAKKEIKETLEDSDHQVSVVLNEP